MNDNPRSPDDFSRSLAEALLPANLPPVNILVVDDEPRNLTVLETILSDPGYRLIRALSPDEALLALVNHEFALLILDVQMPGMTGFELAQTIKSRKKTAQIPIIFLTAHFNDDQHVLEGYGTGAVDYMLKPVNAAALRSKVDVFTELHRRGRDLAIANRALAAEVVERTRAEDELRRWNAQLDLRVAERTHALNASNARVRLATEALGLGFWLWNLDADHWRWENEWPSRVFNGAQEDWPASSAQLIACLHPNDGKRFAEAARAIPGSDGRFRFEGRLTSCKGGEHAVEIEGRLVDEGSAQRTLLGTIRDVSDRYRAERDLRESEVRYRTLFQSIDEGFCVVDMVFDDGGVARDFRFRETNAAFHRHSGLGEVGGMLASEFIPAVEQIWLDGLGKVAMEGKPFRHHGRVEGLARIVDIYAFVIETPEGRSVAMLFRDVTERKRSEEALLERERFLTTVTEAARVGIAVIDSTYRYRFVNDSFRRILNASGPIRVGQRVGSLNAKRWESVKPAVDRALAGESLSIEFAVHSAQDQGGMSRPTHICAFLEPHTDVNMSRTVAVVLIDITPLKRLEAELRDADRHKDEFLATLAHELRNPLAPVRNAVSILQLSTTDNPPAIRAGAIIQRQVKVMARLIDDLMDVARINQGRLELQLERVSLDDVLNLALESSRPQIEEAGHKLEVVLQDVPQMVEADPTRLAQVFMNILTNAAKYTERGGHIAMASRIADGQVHVTVRDSGIGIARENIDRVFEMFSQVEIALARSRGGLGIGLSLAKRLVEMHGGSISARSEGLGKGSEFEVVLPIMTELVATPERSSRDLASPSRAVRILVVDDNIDGAETLGALLEMRGFSVAMAFDGEAAVERAESFHPEVVLLDIGLPKKNGYEVCRAIKAMPWSVGIKIVAITGWGDANAKQAALDAGFDRHFVKPVTEELLMCTIEELCDGS